MSASARAGRSRQPEAQQPAPATEGDGIGFSLRKETGFERPLPADARDDGAARTAFPKSTGRARVNGRRASSGIILVNRNGLR